MVDQGRHAPGHAPRPLGKAFHDWGHHVGWQFFQHTKSGAIWSGDVIGFFQHLLRHVQGEVVVVLDNAGIHRSKVTQAFVGLYERLALVFLPPYSPELNPIELVWAYMKRNVLGNFCARSVSILKVKLMMAWQRVRYIDLLRQLMDSNLCWYQYPALRNIGPKLRIDSLRRVEDVLLATITAQSMNHHDLSRPLPGPNSPSAKRRRVECDFREEQLTLHVFLRLLIAHPPPGKILRSL